MLEKLRSKWSIMAMTLLLVLFFGIWALVTIFPGTKVVAGEVTAARNPASTPVRIDESATMTDESDVNMVTQKFKCLNQPESVTLHARQVRFLGKHCQADGNSSYKISLINVTNGYEATVYEINDRNVTTDFMELKLGRNQFEFVVETLSGGAPTKSTFEVIRK